MSDLTTVGCATQSLVKCFSNSVLGVNLTTILIDMEPWFIAKEVATLLGYENTKQAILVNVDELDQKMLSYDECKQLFGQKSTNNETLENTDDSRGLSDRPRNNSININSQGMKFINESGLYTLIARSNKPEARRFQRWVTSEVLPSIRKTGSYGLQIDKHDLLLLNISKAKTPEERALAISELEQYHEDEKHALKAENEQLEADNEILTQQRDKAIQTKQQISDSKTAKALGRVGGLVTANNRLKDELYLNRNYRTIGAIAQLNGISENSLNWRLLKSYCNKHGLEVMKIQGVRFKINVYPIESFKALYPELIID